MSGSVTFPAESRLQYCFHGEDVGAEQTQSRPDRLEVHLFRNGKGVIDLDAEIPDGAINPGVAQQ
jgi:hypothetical protein